MTEPTDNPGDTPAEDILPAVALKGRVRHYRTLSDEALATFLQRHQDWLARPREERGERPSLREVDLGGRSLAGVNLYGVDLRDARLDAADLRGANLNECDLSGASLIGARLDGVELARSRLRGTLFGDGAELSGVGLDEADASGVFLSGASLRGARLRKAVLEGAQLDGADLSLADMSDARLGGADLGGCCLAGADLSRARLGSAEAGPANLKDTDLRNSVLQDADLSQVTGLLGDQLGGAVTAGARLPADIAAFDRLGHVEETSKSARTTFLAMLLLCVYAWLTVATTDDAALLTNRGSTPLPIIQTEIPIAWFYWMAPLVLVAIFLYLHLYLQRLWRALGVLPAVFPDGATLDARAYPWLLNGLVHAHLPRLQERRPRLSRLENALTVLLAWWLVPLTLLLLWLRFLPRQDWIGTLVPALLLALACASAVGLYGLAARTLREGPQGGRWPPRPAGRPLLLGIGLLALTGVVSLGAIEGNALREPGGPLIGQGPASWVPRALDLLGYRSYADLREQDVSTPPAGWMGGEYRGSPPLEAVKGARLAGRDLRYAEAVSAFLVAADLRNADLRGANLGHADLRRAWLYRADLRRGRLQWADLRAVRAQHVVLRDAYLPEADLRQADLAAADLRGANLSGADLRDAILVHTRFAGADLRGARLSGAHLQGADLSAARGLSQAQLSAACGDQGTRLPAGLSVDSC